MREHFEGNKIVLQSHSFKPKIFAPVFISRGRVNYSSNAFLDILSVLEFVNRTEKAIPCFLIDKLSHLLLEARGKVDLKPSIDLHPRIGISVERAEFILVFPHALQGPAARVDCSNSNGFPGLSAPRYGT